MKAQDTEHEKVAAAISEATGIPKEAIFSSEVLGVMGLVAALYAWEDYRGRMAVYWADATERELLGVVGLIAAIYAWREWMLFFNPACRRCYITLATYRCHTCGYDRRLDA